MAVTRWPDVVEAVVDLMRAKDGYRTPGDDQPVTDVLVLDGPETWLTGDDGGSTLLIVGGTVTDDDEDPDHGQSGQSVGPMASSRLRDEAGSIVCQVIAQGGYRDVDGYGETFRTLRRKAFNVLATVENLLRENPTLGIQAPRMIAEIGETITPRAYSTEVGAVASVQFEVNYRTRI